MTQAIYSATSEYVVAIENQSMKHRVSVSGVLRKLGVSRSGYHSWKNHTPSLSEQKRTEIQKDIQRIHEESHKIYGAPKVTKKLKEEGKTIAVKTVGNYMRQMGLRAHWAKPYTQTTINSDFSSTLQNILDRQFSPSKPDAVWVSDITYVHTKEGFVYLTSVMDLYSRKIISWELSKTLEAVHVVKCIGKAKKQRRITEPLVFHSDRGVQYVSDIFYKETKDMINSYSPKASPWDNACIESFHALLKREWINQFEILDYNHAYRLIFEYIEAFYNTVRIHSYCDYTSPNQHEKKYRLEQKKIELSHAV